MVTSGAGAAAISIVKLLLSAGFQHVTMCDRKGAIYAGREGLNWIKEEMAQVTNLEKKPGSLAEQLVGADVFIGVSAPNVVTPDMVKSMAAKSILFTMANPVPEIAPDLAREAGAYIVGTGSSQYPNQINNVLVFPGLFRGALDVRARTVNTEMMIAAARGIASYVPPEKLSREYILPYAYDKGAHECVAKAVAQAAIESGVSKLYSK